MRNIIFFVNRTIKTLIAFLASAALLIGCGGGVEESEPSFTPPGLFSQEFSPLDSSSVMDMSELKQLVSNAVSGTVAVANYFPAKNVLLAVYVGDGFLRAWDIDNSKVLLERDLGIVSSIGFGLDESGNQIMGAMLHSIKENDFGELAEYVGGVAIWDTNTGKLLYCVVHPCDRSSSEWQRDAVSGVTFDHIGRWVIENREIWISVSDITDPDTSYSFSEGGDEYPKYTGLVAIDSYNNRYAIALREGEVIIGEIGKTGLGWIISKVFLGTYEEGVRHEITALSFSPDGKWLARIQDDILTVWKTDTRAEKLHLEHKIPDGRLLAFDRASELLFMSTNEAINIWNIKEMSFIGEYATPDITSLSISADNRLLIWGDSSGIVHIWGNQ